MNWIDIQATGLYRKGSQLYSVRVDMFGFTDLGTFLESLLPLN